MLLVYAIALLLGGLLAVNAIFAYQSKHIDPAFWTTVWYQTKLLPVLFTANLMIGFGVKFTYKVFGNLTFALTFSKGIEILVCVLMGFLFMKEVPNWKTLLGLAIVIVGYWISKFK
ncbi:hypothetical protein ACSU6B_19755 [Neobacillus sp. C211]|uniref:hypothetical protein n=1 Tax=Bacillaceae TaxID=186817 RepID=UPI001BE764A9|nr:hypothetical protein [Bacillus sp. ISL-7]MBT2738999.1 hypothetical protein [Bacillus sp. ISL-7]